jgi:hypothetical protein
VDCGLWIFEGKKKNLPPRYFKNQQPEFINHQSSIINQKHEPKVPGTWRGHLARSPENREIRGELRFRDECHPASKNGDRGGLGEDTV